MAGLFYDPEVPDAFWAKLAWNTQPSGCWSWAPPGPSAYPAYPVFRGRGAARYLYQVQVRKLHAGEAIAPGCFNQSCVNPDHMKVVISGQNVAHAAYRDRVRTEVN